MAADVWRWNPAYRRWLQDKDAKTSSILPGSARGSTLVTPNSRGKLLTSRCSLSSRPDCPSERPSGSVPVCGRWPDDGPYLPPSYTPTAKNQKGRTQVEVTFSTSRPPFRDVEFDKQKTDLKDGNTICSKTSANVQQSTSSKISKWLFETPVQRSDLRKDQGSCTPPTGTGLLQSKSEYTDKLMAEQMPYDMMHSQAVCRESAPACVPEIDSWVTVFASQPAVSEYGEEPFSLGPKELRTVMLEFEKCGKIIDHIPGSEGTDWVHIQYQTTFEAGMALMKNGLKLNEVLLVSVRKLDKSQREKLSNDTKRSTWSLSGHKNQVEINPPVKSSISRFVDLVFDCERDYQISPAGFFIPIKFELGLYKELFSNQPHRCDDFYTEYCDPTSAPPLYYEYPRLVTSQPCGFANKILDLESNPEFYQSPQEERVGNKFSETERFPPANCKTMSFPSQLRHQEPNAYESESEAERSDSLHVSHAQQRDLPMSEPTRRDSAGQDATTLQLLRLSKPVQAEVGPSSHYQLWLQQQERENIEPEKAHTCPVLQVVRGEGPLSSMNFTNRQWSQARRHTPTCIYLHEDKRIRRYRHDIGKDCYHSLHEGALTKHRKNVSERERERWPQTGPDCYRSFYQGVPTQETGNLGERERDPSHTRPDGYKSFYQVVPTQQREPSQTRKR